MDRRGGCDVDRNCTYKIFGPTSRTRIGGLLDDHVSMDDVRALAHELVHAAGLHSKRIESRSGVPAACANQEEKGNPNDCVNRFQARILQEIHSSRDKERSNERDPQ